jgi:thioredoxin-related protein
MKKSVIITILSIQFLILGGVAASIYFTFMNKERIRATQRVMVDTQEKLETTFAFMDEVAKSKKQIEDAQKPLVAGADAPSFSLKDENQNEITLANYKGKKTLLVFSQESCPYCEDFYPVLNAFKETQPNVEVVIMQLGSAAENNKAYKEQKGINATILAATQVDMENYKVLKTPTSILLDEEGKIIASKTITELDQLFDFVGKP